MDKINIDSDGVVIGSRTISEYKFQVLNFLNLLWHEIGKVDDMEASIGSADSWAHNLTVEINHIRKETSDSDFEFYGRIYSLIETLRYKIKNKGNKRDLKERWKKILLILTDKFDLKYTINRSINGRR